MSFFTSLHQLVSDAGSSISESARRLVTNDSNGTAGSGSQDGDDGVDAGLTMALDDSVLSSARNSVTSVNTATLHPPPQANNRRRSSLFTFTVGAPDDEKGSSADNGGGGGITSWSSMWLQPTSSGGSNGGGGGEKGSNSKGPSTWDVSPGGLSRSRRNSSVK